eukprot:8710791-Alexandrium_andersonii.AAC.1
MSASLVGSEMCIRDSRSALLRGSGRAFDSGRRPLLRRLPASLLRSLPVSYTHLTLPTICSV